MHQLSFMNEYKFSSFLIARIPLLDCRIREYPAVLESENFRAALFFASRSFYNELSKKQFNYSLLSEKQKRTVEKYINRAKFRATPFGLFASVCALEWGGYSNDFDSEPKADVKLDFAVLYEFWDLHLKNNTNNEQQFQSNASLYLNSIDFRYIKKLVDGNRMKFSVVSIEKNQILRSLITFCRKPKSLKQILNFLIKKNVFPNDAKNFIQDLVDEEILVSTLSPHITGPDYSHVSANSIFKDSIIGDIDRQLQKKISISGNLEQILSLANKMDRYFNKPDCANYFYCISEREGTIANVDLSYQKSIEEGLYCLGRLSQSYVAKDLQSFVKAFVKKYETQEVPLLEALDAQFGIGYGGLDRLKVSYGFSSTGFNSTVQEETTADRGKNQLAAWLIKEWQLHFKSSYELEITDQQLEHLKKAETSEIPAPSISVLFRTLGDKVVIESAGGPSALALIGRFGCFENVYQPAKLIAEEEQRQNPNVIFAEIAHLCHLHTANINRRPHFYDYEIPVLTHSQLRQEMQIPLNDLMVSVVDDKIVLRSRRLKKRIIPRLSSAFNYTRNDLPVFRFLCDLQTQGIKTNFGFSFASLIPGLSFYPRVTYKSAILQLAEWHMDPNKLRKINRSEDVFLTFRQLAHSINLPQFFSYCVGDNFLVFDSNKKEDIHLFLKETAHKTSVTIKEFPFLNKPASMSAKENFFLPQYVAALVLQKKEVYNDPQSFSEKRMSQQQVKTTDWIYFKLYCHPLSSDIILINDLLPLIDKLQKENLLINWFWVRYNDPDYHLRIRIKVNARAKRKVIQALTICFDKICRDKLATQFQAASYTRELERYSPELIEEVEEVFHASSELVAGWLIEQNEINYEDSNTILDAAAVTEMVLNAFSIPDKAAFCKKAFESFFSEINASKELKTEMEKLYKRLDIDLDLAINSSQKTIKCRWLLQKVRRLVARYHEKKVTEVTLEKLAMDIIHMHLNRFFIYNQRYFEMVQYYLLYRSQYKRLYKTIQ